MIPQSNHQYNTQSIEDVAIFYCRTDVLELNKLDMQIRRSESFLSFKNSLLKIGRPTAKPTYNIHNPIGLKFLTRLRLGLSHLNEHKFRHNFQDCINPLCSIPFSMPFTFLSALPSFHKHTCNPLRCFAVS